mgnify:CR=1 FL=1
MALVLRTIHQSEKSSGRVVGLVFSMFTSWLLGIDHFYKVGNLLLYFNKLSMSLSEKKYL